MRTCSGKCRKGAIDPECLFHTNKCGQGVLVYHLVDTHTHDYGPGTLIPCPQKLGHDGKCGVS